MLYSPVSGLAYLGTAFPKALDYRNMNQTARWAFNPWTGGRRHAQDVASDPYGMLIVIAGEPLEVAEPVFKPKAAKAAPAVASNVVMPDLLAALARDLLDPEMFGLAVTAEVRNRARRALGIEARETTS